MKTAVSLCKGRAKGYKQKYTALSASQGCGISNILFTRADTYGSSSLPWGSLLKTWPSTVHPHPAQCTHLLSHKTNNVLQLWLAFLLCVIQANLLPSHTEQLAPSGLTCFLGTFWGLHRFSTNTALCLCPEVSGQRAAGVGRAGAIALLYVRGICVLSLVWLGTLCRRQMEQQSKTSWRSSPPSQHQLPSPD